MASLWSTGVGSGVMTSGLRPSPAGSWSSSTHPPGAEADQALKAIRAEYRRRFAQQSVLRVDRGVAASF